MVMRRQPKNNEPVIAVVTAIRPKNQQESLEKPAMRSHSID